MKIKTRRQNTPVGNTLLNWHLDVCLGHNKLLHWGARGMLRYLSNRVRPEIQMVVHQTARYSMNPMRSHMWAPCGHDWSCVILDWSEGPFFWHFKTANACFFSKVYTTMKFQLVFRKFQLVCTPIPERYDWSVQTHWFEGAHVWLESMFTVKKYFAPQNNSNLLNICPLTFVL